MERFIQPEMTILLGTVKQVLKAVIIFAEFFKKVFTGNSMNFSSCLTILLEFNFTCSNTLESNCTDSLIQMCAKFSRMSRIYLFCFQQSVAELQSHSHKSNSESHPSKSS